MTRVALLLYLLCFGVTAFAQQTGYASFYADKFVGRKTANGEIYSHEGATAAHKRLPFGTVLKVTNLKNNKSVIVKVNDRGPHSRRFIIDLTKGAAKALDIFDGSQTVKLEVLGNTADSTIIVPTLAAQLGLPDSLQPKVVVAVDTLPLKSDPPSLAERLELPSTGALVKNLYQVVPVRATKNDYGVKLGTFESFQKLNVQLSKLGVADQQRALVFLTKTRKRNEYTLILGPFASKVAAKNHPKAGKANIILLKSLNK